MSSSSTMETRMVEMETRLGRIEQSLMYVNQLKQRDEDNLNYSRITRASDQTTKNFQSFVHRSMSNKELITEYRKRVKSSGSTLTNDAAFEYLENHHPLMMPQKKSAVLYWDKFPRAFSQQQDAVVDDFMQCYKRYGECMWVPCDTPIQRVVLSGKNIDVVLVQDFDGNPLIIVWDGNVHELSETVLSEALLFVSL